MESVPQQWSMHANANRRRIWDLAGWPEAYCRLDKPRIYWYNIREHLAWTITTLSKKLSGFSRVKNYCYSTPPRTAGIHWHRRRIMTQQRTYIGSEVLRAVFASSSWFSKAPRHAVYRQSRSIFPALRCFPNPKSQTPSIGIVGWYYRMYPLLWQTLLASRQEDEKRDWHGVVNLVQDRRNGSTRTETK